MFAKPSLDFSRHAGLIDHDLLARTPISLIGAGGAASLALSLARLGTRRFIIADPDHVSTTNPTTQAHDHADIGKPKPLALARRIRAINPDATVTIFNAAYEDLSPAHRAVIWQADIVLAMTDRFPTQARINRDAIANNVDTILGICYIRAAGFEITATFPADLKHGIGCHRCHTKARYDAYAAGFKNPSAIASHALAAEYINSLLGHIVLGRLHYRAGSALEIAELGYLFTQRPCLISRTLPAFGIDPGEAFHGRELMPFSTTMWSLDTPSDWTCPDCGTRNALPAVPPVLACENATLERR